MKGDFSRFIYDDQKGYSLVLMQQGRVQLDSDWNEQALLHWFDLQHLAQDLIGEHGGPRNDFGFKIVSSVDESGANVAGFSIEPGRYYVKGAMCQLRERIDYDGQPGYPFPDSAEIESGKKYLIYLHLWWRHITSLEDDRIREVALGGPDTTTRIQTVWQVKAVELRSETSISNLKTDYQDFTDILTRQGIIKRTTGRLQARALQPPGQDQPCITSPGNRYRGNENQLYRVEIHRSGAACDANGSTADYPCATFKWSRENGSVVFPILELAKNKVTLEHLGRDDRFGLEAGDWVEIVNDDYVLQRRAEQLFKVTEVDPDNREITLSGNPAHNVDLSKHPLLRRWDQTGQTRYEGAVPVEEGKWIDLEDGIQIQFTKPENGQNQPPWYQSGSWWWIPARNITGDVEWPQENNEPAALHAMDAGDRYAPLALLGNVEDNSITDYRRKFIKLWE